MNRLGLHVLVIDQLRRSEDEGEEAVVVQSPDTVRPRRLQAIHQLQFPHQFQILHEDSGNHRLVILLLDHSHPRQAVQPRHEVGLVSGSVVDAARVAEAIGEVGHDLDRRRSEVVGEESEHQRVAALDQPVVPRPVGDVAVAGGLLSGGDFVDPED